MSEDSIKYPVELPKVDISSYEEGNRGIPYVTTFDSGVEGDNILIMAVTHGNEICGPIVLDFLFKNNVRPKKGKLTLAFSNVAAFESFDKDAPEKSRFVDEDMNRVWSSDVLEGDRVTTETTRARQIRQIVDEADFIFDIHSMQTAIEPLMICGPLDKGRQYARELGVPEFIVSDAGHAAGTRMRDYADFGNPSSPKNALLLEAGQHWAKSSGDVALDATIRYLKMHNVIDQDAFSEHEIPNPPKQKLVVVTDAVTIKNGSFKFAEPFIGFECLEKAGTLIGWDGDEEVVTPYDNCVLVMPSRRQKVGDTAVRLGRLED